MEILGSSPEQLNQALECWAEVTTQCSAESAQAFGRAQWSLLAEAFQGVRWEPTAGNPGELMAAGLEDAEEQQHLAEKWLGSGHETKVAELLGTLRELDYAHGWAMIQAIQWFWDHHEEVDLTDEPWWTLQYRLLFEGAVRKNPE
jgi:hypothetical protein